MNAPCHDCQHDTVPADGIHLHEWYMVHDEVWQSAVGPETGSGYYLCVGCLEKRLGRRLTGDDFKDLPVNTDPHHQRFDSDRIADRRAA